MSDWRTTARLLVRLAIDDRTARTRFTMLGAYWGVLLPLVESGVFTLAFGVLVRARTLPVRYLLFVFVGTLAWRTFARGVVAGAASLPRAAALLQQMPVSAHVIVTAAIAGATVDGLLGVPVLLVLVSVLGRVPGLGQLASWVAVGLTLQLGITFGLGCLMATANAFYRDFGLALGPALNILMFAAPVVYATSLVPRSLEQVFLANPMAAAIESYRAGLLGAVPVPWASLAAAATVAALSLLVGVAVLRRLDPRIREVV
jgi:lipopolysaccharide transport system permease protein